MTICVFLPVYSVFISVQTNGSVATPTVGKNYSLTCIVSGARVTSYQWWKDGTVLSVTAPILSFSPIILSDAGWYSCNVTVDGVVYSDDENVFTSSRR